MPIAHPIKRFLEAVDLRLNAPGQSVLTEWMRIQRHPLAALLLGPLVAAALCVGPTATSGSRWWAAAVALVVFAFVSGRLMRWTESRNVGIAADVALQVLMLLVTAGAVWFVGQGAVERDRSVYQHTGVILVAIVAVSGIVVYPFGLMIFSRLFKPPNTFEALRAALHAMQNDLEILAKGDFRYVGRAGTIALTLLQSPLRLLLFPAFIILVWQTVLWWGWALCIVVAWLAVLWLSPSRTSDETVDRIEGPFLTGASRIVSAFVILVAAARVAGCST